MNYIYSFVFKCEEYLEITSGRTVLPLILEGIGLIPELDFKPNALVFRLNTARNKIAECTIEISNICNATVTVNFEKILELEGHILRSQKNIEKSPRGKSPRKGKKSNKKADKSKKSDKSVKKSVLKFSDTLTDAEETSIEKNFTKRIGDSLFDILNIDGNRMEIPGNSTNPLKLGFGNPDILLKKKMEIKEVAKKGKKRGKGKDKKSSSGTSKESKKATDKTYYLSKYNIKLSNRVIKEIILICFFK
ncbi:hypothetical protein JTB14_018252 [Gonioctena quinquepunctata]|nr:hypothetical protein JTB14_018252 [Gonioctena quinquepunctata]